MLIKKDKQQLVYLEWGDAMAEGGWKRETEIDTWIKEANWIVKQCGWIIEEKPHYIVLASRISFDNNPEWEGSYGNLQKIPKTWIQKKVVLTKYICPKKQKKQ